jgi:hypothetical protein
VSHTRSHTRSAAGALGATALQVAPCPGGHEVVRRVAQQAARHDFSREDVCRGRGRGSQTALSLDTIQPDSPGMVVAKLSPLIAGEEGGAALALDCPGPARLISMPGLRFGRLASTHSRRWRISKAKDQLTRSSSPFSCWLACGVGVSEGVGGVVGVEQR